jgi:hypothetical protein
VPSINEFILSNKDSIKKRCTTVSNISVNSLFEENKVIQKTVYNFEMVKKWWGFLPGHLSKEYREILCFFCEVLYIYEQYSSSNFHNIKVNVIDELKLILTKINNNNNRSKILGQYYNYSNNQVEYLLEDGNYVPIEPTNKPFINTDLSVFPDSFIKLIDEQEYRNIQINNII